MKICYWGSGPISNFHIPAIKSSGIEIISCFSRAGSKNLIEFCHRHSVPQAKSEGEFLKQCAHADAVLVALKTEHTYDALLKLKGITSYVFFEKPGVFEGHKFDALKRSSTQYFSLYNRRFYKPIEVLKKRIVDRQSPINMTFTFPDTKKGWHQFYINGCHMVDLSMFLLDDYDLKISFCKLADSVSGFSFIAESNRGDLLTFVNQWGGSETASLIVYDGQSTYKLQPMEKLQISTEMAVNEPTDNMPIRSYVPKVSDQYFVATAFKPGFKEQIEDIKRTMQGDHVGCLLGTLDQSQKVVNFINELEKRSL